MERNVKNENDLQAKSRKATEVIPRFHQVLRSGRCFPPLSIALATSLYLIEFQEGEKSRFNPQFT